MRSLWMCVLLVASCKKQSAPPAQHGSGSAAVAAHGDASLDDASSIATVADAETAGDAAIAALVNLFEVVPTTIRVSSQVRNKKILPAHLVDRSMQTSWNSLTGELVGAWVDVALPAGTHITELRLTVGHTGKGPKGQDYFTMNPRITKVRVAADGKAPVEVALDPEKRELQAVAVDATTHVRLTVVAVKPGSKKTWREIAISELEAWGTPVPGTAIPAKRLTPDVFVGEDREIPAGFCDEIEQLKEEREEERKKSEEMCNERETQEDRDQCNVDPPGDPECSVDEADTKLAAPWNKPSVVCITYDNVYGPRNCTLNVRAGNASVQVDDVELPAANETIDVTDAKLTELDGGPPAELELHYDRGDSSGTDMMVVCRLAPTLSCTAPMTETAAINSKLIFK